MKTVFKKFGELHDKIDEKINNDCAKFADIRSRGIAADLQKKDLELKLVNFDTESKTEDSTPVISEEDERI